MAKSAWIKSFKVDQVLKNNGVEIQIDDDGKQMGDLRVAKTGIVWCDGKASKNSTKISFDDLSWIAYYKDEVMKAVKAARKRDGN